MSAERVPVLLNDAGYYGTLAAARALGRDGIPVTIANPSRVASALWSRHVTRRLRCPPPSDLDDFVGWLRNLGRAGERHVICATSDDVSLALALNRSELDELFVFYQPALASLIALVDKSRLLGHACAVGLDVPDTWLPQSDAEADRVIREAEGTLVIKPRTQALLRTHAKGAVVVGGRGGRSAGAYARFRHDNVYAAPLAARFPSMMWPMIQRFHAEAIESVYSLAGFRDRSGEHLVMKGAQKVLQRPRHLGVGLCFEDAPVAPELAAGLRRLFDRVGYFGVFEAEFIRVGGRSLLIDLNARLYNQMAFDIARGLPLPRLLYDAALGRDGAVADAIASVARRNGAGPRGFCNRFELAVFVGAKRLSGDMSSDDAARWRSWLGARNRSVIDAVADRDDPRPMAFEVAHQLFSFVRHPRAFVRTLAFDS
jgi:predicted ATP-grasp superfamily ATP-dependent carboligase